MMIVLCATRSYDSDKCYTRLCNAMLCYDMSYDSTLCVMPYHIISCHRAISRIMTLNVVLCYAMLCCAVSCHVMYVNQALTTCAPKTRLRTG